MSENNNKKSYTKDFVSSTIIKALTGNFFLGLIIVIYSLIIILNFYSATNTLAKCSINSAELKTLMIITSGAVPLLMFGLFLLYTFFYNRLESVVHGRLFMENPNYKPPYIEPPRAVYLFFIALLLAHSSFTLNALDNVLCKTIQTIQFNFFNTNMYKGLKLTCIVSTCLFAIFLIIEFFNFKYYIRQTSSERKREVAENARKIKEQIEHEALINTLNEQRKALRTQTEKRTNKPQVVPKTESNQKQPPPTLQRADSTNSLFSYQTLPQEVPTFQRTYSNDSTLSGDALVQQQLKDYRQQNTINEQGKLLEEYMRKERENEKRKEREERDRERAQLVKQAHEAGMKQGRAELQQEQEQEQEQKQKQGQGGAEAEAGAGAEAPASVATASGAEAEAGAGVEAPAAVATAAAATASATAQQRQGGARAATASPKQKATTPREKSVRSGVTRRIRTVPRGEKEMSERTAMRDRGTFSPFNKQKGKIKKAAVLPL